jgi:hypothetical protein
MSVVFGVQFHDIGDDFFSSNSFKDVPTKSNEMVEKAVLCFIVSTMWSPASANKRLATKLIMNNEPVNGHIPENNDNAVAGEQCRRPSDFLITWARPKQLDTRVGVPRFNALPSIMAAVARSPSIVMKDLVVAPSITTSEWKTRLNQADRYMPCTTSNIF